MARSRFSKGVKKERPEDWADKMQQCYNDLAYDGEDYPEIRAAMLDRFGHILTNHEVSEFVKAQPPLPTIPRHVYNNGTTAPYRLVFGRAAQPA